MSESKIDKGTTTEKVTDLKINDYARETVKRVLAHVYLQMLKSGDVGHKTVDAVDNIAREWNNDKTVTDFQKVLGQLVTIAETKNNKVASEINKTFSEVNQKAKNVTEFKNSLRQGGFLGKLVGGELLARVGYHPELLQDPIVLVGADFVIESLKQEQGFDFENTNLWDSAPEDLRDFHAGIMNDQQEVLKEIINFREALKLQQIAPVPLIQNSN